jgi:restriction endonuclease
MWMPCRAARNDPPHDQGTLGQREAPAPLGVKVLSLFFIDEVAKYRQYDEQGNAVKGEYALMFEEEYKRWARTPTTKACSTRLT